MEVLSVASWSSMSASLSEFEISLTSGVALGKTGLVSNMSWKKSYSSRSLVVPMSLGFCGGESVELSVVDDGGCSAGGFGCCFTTPPNKTPPIAIEYLVVSSSSDDPVAFDPGKRVRRAAS